MWRNILVPPLLVAGLILAGRPAPAQSPGEAPLPAPQATTFAAGVIEPLREIGRVKAHTPFCKTFLAQSSLGVSSALEFERQLLMALGKLQNVDLGDELHKHKSLEAARKNINLLADLALAGRAELQELKDLPVDDERHQAMVEFVDALDGAKGRQMTIARQLSRAYGTIAELPVYTTVTLPTDDKTTAFNKRNSGSVASKITGSLMENQSYAQAIEINKSTFDAIPGDAEVGRDLLHAGEHGRQVLALGGC
jgi:hypothetical protein